MPFLILAFLFYFFIILSFLYGTIRFNSKNKNKSCNLGVSVIIAIRNGEKALLPIIGHLQQQDYRGNIEFILVDDESTDNTKKIISDIIFKDRRFKYYSSSQGSKHLKNKKRALDLGISNANYNYLLFTDVDCLLPESWISTMATYYNDGYNYLVGSSFSKYDKDSNYVSKFQATDFLLLMIMCRASAFFGYPLASSGQNQGFTKKLYKDMGGFRKINSFLGDDTAFLQFCYKRGAKPCFIDNINAQVISRRESKISKFLIQRSRWVSDANKIWKINKFFFTLLMGVFLFYLSLPMLFFINAYLFITLITFKILIEYLLFYYGAFFLSSNFYFRNFILWEIFHAPYIITVGLMSYFIRFFKWKGRRLI